MLPIEKFFKGDGMECSYGILKDCILFKGLNNVEILELLSKAQYTVKLYKRDEVVAVEEEECRALAIVIEGEVHIQKIYASGKTVTLARLGPGKIFGEAIIFSNTRVYPATVVAAVDTRIMYITKEDIINFCRFNPVVLENFMRLLSNKILMLNRKIKELSLETLRHKVCNFILEEYNKQKNLTLKLNLSRKAMAEQMGVQRPSLSRELIRLKNEGFINFNKNSLTIKDLEGLEELLV